MNGRDCNNPRWKFDFGKYKGRTVAEIMEEDPDYLEWCEEEGIMYFHDDCDPNTGDLEDVTIARANCMASYFPHASTAIH